MKFLFTLTFLLFFTLLKAQKIKPASSNDMIMECMKMNGDGANKQMAIWFPYNFWEMIGEQMKISPEIVETIVTHLKDYTMFCVVDYTHTNTGFIFKPESEIRETIRLIDSSKNILKPLTEKEIPDEVKRLLKNIHPTLSQMLGQFGEGMQVYLFKSKNINNSPSLNVFTKNNFTLSWNTTNLNWKLPLSSLLPTKFCPIDNETMKGDWNYCPTHGSKLDK